MKKRGRKPNQYKALTEEQRQLVVEELKPKEGEIHDRITTRAKVYCSKNKLKYIEYKDVLAIFHETLCRAASDYDPSLGCTFGAFVWYRLHCAEKNIDRDHDRFVPLPRKIYEIRDYVSYKILSGTSAEDIANELDIDVSLIHEANESRQEENRSIDIDDREEHPPTQLTARPTSFVSEFSDAENEVVANLEDDEITLLTRYLAGEFKSEHIIKKAEELLHRVKSDLGLISSGEGEVLYHTDAFSASGASCVSE